MTFFIRIRSFFFVSWSVLQKLKLSGAWGVKERHCSPPSLEEFAHTQIRLVHYEGVHDQILSHEKMVRIVSRIMY